MSQGGEHAESSHLGDIEGEMGCSGTGEMRKRDGVGGKKISWEVDIVRGLEERGGDEDRDRRGGERERACSRE